MTRKSITWDEIEAIFNRCDEVHLSPNLAQAIEAQRAGTTKIDPVEDESAVAESDAPKGE